MLRNHFTGQQPGQQPGGAMPTKPLKPMKPMTPMARRRTSGLLDQYNDWAKSLQQRGELLRGDESDWQRFMSERGYGGHHLPGESEFGGRALPMLRKYFHGNVQEKRVRYAASVFQRKVAGWDWDDHLNGYVANAPTKFACDCGNSFSTPSYNTCRCGKTWNSYVIGTGGDRHQAAAEKYICRQIDERPDMIVANRRYANETGPEQSEWWTKHNDPTTKKFAPDIPLPDGVAKPKKLIGQRRTAMDYQAWLRTEHPDIADMDWRERNKLPEEHRRALGREYDEHVRGLSDVERMKLT